MNIFGKRLKEFRRKNQLTQGAFAKRINVTQSAVAKWETGNRIPSVEILYNICIEFNVSCNYLIGLSNS